MLAAVFDLLADDLPALRRSRGYPSNADILVLRTRLRRMKVENAEALRAYHERPN